MVDVVGAVEALLLGEVLVVGGTVTAEDGIGVTICVVLTWPLSTSAIQRHAQFSETLLVDSHDGASVRIMHSTGTALTERGRVFTSDVALVGTAELEVLNARVVLGASVPAHMPRTVTWKRVTTSDPALPSVALLTTRQSGATTRSAVTLLSDAPTDANSGATMSASVEISRVSSARASTTSFAPLRPPDTAERLSGATPTRKLPAPSTTTIWRNMSAATVTLLVASPCAMRIGHVPPDLTAMSPGHESAWSMQPLPSQYWHMGHCRHAPHGWLTGQVALSGSPHFSLSPNATLGSAGQGILARVHAMPQNWQWAALVVHSSHVVRLEQSILPAEGEQDEFLLIKRTAPRM